MENMVRKYKIVVMGSGGVGKTALIKQFISETFSTEFDPTVVDYYETEIEIGNYKVILEIIDTAGQEEFSAFRESYIHQGKGFILVYSITSAPSFIGVKSFRNQICRVKDDTATPMVLVGTKSDLDLNRCVSAEDGKALAQAWGCPFFETSAKLGNNVRDTFHEIVNCIEKNREEVEKVENNSCCACTVL